ncbi:MAG: glycosyltransferase family 39 protein [Candidatus Methanoperedens sp.]|nr:glycosyltransferase family 39 protein [Candidatus Methanoperedens sp.]
MLIKNYKENIIKTKFLDLFISSALFLLSFIISSYYSNVIFGIMILLSFGFVINTIFIKSRSLSLTEHFIVGAGIGLFTLNLLMASLVYLNKPQFFKYILLLLFLLALAISVIKRYIVEFKGYYFNRDYVFSLIIFGMFFFVSVVLRHADFRFPDEYMYLNKIVGIVSGGYISDYAQDRYFLHYSYSSILEFAPLTFKSVEIASLFFFSMSLIPTYLLGKELFNREVGCFAALFLAFNPSFIFHSIRLLPEAPLLFFITSFLYFFYKWSKIRSTIDFFISCIFLLLAIFVKFHGIIFLGIGTVYILLNSNFKYLKKNIIYLSILIVALLLLIIWNLHYNLYLILSSLFSRIVNEISNDVIWVGYKAYITYFSPDLYSMPFIVLFFFGTAAFLKDSFNKKIFLLTPIAIYIMFLSLTGGLFGIGVRNFLVIVPLMSIIAAYGIVQRERVNRGVFWILLNLYLIALAIMVIYAPRFPHLNFVLPDLPLWIRVLTFSAAFAVVLLMLHDWKTEKWQKAQCLIISLVIISSLLNANFFINIQEGYPDRSKSGILEAGKWFSENTLSNARIQSSTWELPFWMDTNTKSNPGMRYPKSTILSYYVDRITYAPPANDELFLERIKYKEVDYIVIFTDELLTTSDDTRETYKYLQKYVHEAPSGTELVHTMFNKNQKILFRVYQVI